MRSRAVAALFLAFAALVAAGAYAYHRTLARTVRQQREHELLTIARLKVDQVEAFRRERLGNGRTIHENPGMSRASWPLLEQHDPAAVAAHLEGWFGPLASHYGYSDVVVLDDRFSVMARWDTSAAELPSHARALAQRALRDNEVLLADPQREPGTNELILDLAVPLVARTGSMPGAVAGVLLMRSRVADALGPMVASWPTPTTSGETFIVGKEGERMEYFTEPLHGLAPMLYQGVPLDRTEHPGVQAALGRFGIVEGRDRSGEHVVAALQPIRGSDWVLVAKMDVAEVMAPLRAIDRALVVSVAALLASAGALLAMWYHRQLAASRRAAATAEQEHLTRQFEALLEAANDAILLVDPTSRVIAVNDRAAELYGWKRDEMIGRHAGELFGRPDADVEQAFAAAHERGGLLLERVHRRRDGTPFPIEASVRTYGTGERRYALTIVRDISERRRTELQLRQTDRLTAMGALAAGVAHEINNPLSFVLGNVEWALERLAQGERSDVVTTALTEARDGAQRVQAIVRDLKTFSRAEEDAGARKPVDVVTVLRSSINIAQNSIRQRAQLVADLKPAPPVDASEQRLGQVFLNLLLNAAEAIPDDQQQHHVFVSTRVMPDGFVAVEVRDTGVGIPPDVQRRMFEPFFTTKPEGTGLGLSICHGIVENLGGRIEVESAAGHGSTFRVLLPPSVSIAAAATAPPTAGTGASSGRVLIVDDEPLVAASAARLLGRAHQVVTATSARDALTRIEDGDDFDVILCDLMMPGMTGMELWETLARLRPGTERRMIFVTGGTFTQRAREFLETTANTWLEKPFDPALLRDAVADQVRRRHESARAS